MFLASNKITGPLKDFISTFLLKADWKLKILFALGLERRKKLYVPLEKKEYSFFVRQNHILAGFTLRVNFQL